MDIRNTTEAFLEALKETYYNNEANESTDFLKGECRVLSYLNIDNKKGFRPSELSNCLNITTPRTASIIKSLEKKGYITREISNEDKRVAYVSITEKGSQYIEMKRERVCCFFDRSFIRLDENERDEFIRLLEKLANKN